MKNLNKIEEKIKWSKYYNITDKNMWRIISSQENLSEDFIREFADKVNWYNICRKQTLSESFIKEFKDKVDWQAVSTWQKLSEDFIHEFKDYIVWSRLIIYNDVTIKNLSKEFKQKIKIEIKNETINRY